MSRHILLITLITIALATRPAQLQALDPELRLGPHEVVAGLDLRSKLVDNGGLRHNDVVTRAYGRGRFHGVGLQLDAFIAVGNDHLRDTDAGEIPQMSVRIDYLIDMPWFQMIPRYTMITYPAFSNVDEAHWLGLDAWVLLPWEGVEAGASVDFDLDDNYGWHAAIGSRQFLQTSGIDLHAWQLLNYGSSDYHQYLGAGDRRGLTTLNLGGKVTVPLPFIHSWITAGLDGHWWLNSRDRAAVENSTELIMSFGFEFRL